MTTKQQAEPGIYFYAINEETHKKLRVLESLLNAAEIFTRWQLSDWHGEKVQSLAVYAHGNTVAPFLGMLRELEEHMKKEKALNS